MQVLKGQPVSPGYVQGIAVVIDNGTIPEIPKVQIGKEDVDAELSRFHQALEASCNELTQLERRVMAELGGTYSTIFASHLSLLTDRQFTEQIRRRVRQDLVNVEQALDVQVSELVRLLGSLDNEYLCERARDIRDLGNRLMRQLLRGETHRYVQLAPRSVIVAHDLLPSETIDLDREHVIGIVTEEGGENSHSAILARALGIPAVTGVVDATSLIDSGSELMVDGNLGQVTLHPTEAAFADMATLKSDYDESTAAAVDAEGMECVTLDGVKVSLLANLNRRDELRLVDAHKLDGVGLFRTEFLYMDSPVAPSLERQVETYQSLLDGLGGRKLVVRTLDLGADKLPLFLHSHYETNPSLGLRGLRFALEQQELFMTQIRALLNTASDGDLRILFPMVLGQSDLREACQHVERLSDGLQLSRMPRLGAMIETPASLFSLKEILQQVEFINIGTNDLTQFMLAVDRDAAERVADYSVLHPSVLRAIGQVVQACDEAGRQLCVCGEAAGEVGTACLLVGLGVRELSMSPIRAARVRLGIRTVAESQLSELAEQALQAGSVNEVHEMVKQFQQDWIAPLESKQNESA